ncbi:hypothetical protein EXIGLDRAFT_730758, partial [Exidia glandulosa HHB12029]
MQNNPHETLSARWDSSVHTDLHALRWIVPLRQSEIPPAAKSKLLAAYGSKTCAVTKEYMFIDWTHLSPHPHEVRTNMISYLQSLQLLPPQCGIYDPLIVLPLDLTRQILFNNLALTPFPTESTLLEYITMEEGWKVYRDGLYRSSGADVGRPPYRAAMGLTTFEIFFSPVVDSRMLTIDASAKNPTLFDTTKENLRLNLPLSVPAVIHTCLARMARLTPSPRTDRLVRWALYLSALWTCELGRQPQLARPPELAFSPPELFSTVVLRGVHAREPYWGPRERSDDDEYDEDLYDLFEDNDGEALFEAMDIYGNGKEAIKANIDVLIGTSPQTVLFTQLISPYMPLAV